MILPNSGYTPKEALEYSQRAFDILGQQNIVNAYIYDTQGYLLALCGRVDEGNKPAEQGGRIKRQATRASLPTSITTSVKRIWLFRRRSPAMPSVRTGEPRKSWFSPRTWRTNRSMLILRTRLKRL